MYMLRHHEQDSARSIMKHDPNPLERALRLAAKDAANRPDFFRLLLESQVFVVGDAAETEDGDRPMDAGESVSLHKWDQPDGSSVIPFFTSRAAVAHAIEGEASCLGLPARELFEHTRGSTLVLNPNHKYGKQFSPQDIDAMLAGGIPSSAQMRPGQDETDVTISQPEKYPTRMVDALITFFAKRGQVKAAFLAQLKYHPSTGKKSRLIVGIHTEGDFDRLATEVAAVIADTGPRDELLNLYRVAPGDEGIAAAFFEHFKPFYENSWGSRLSSTSTFEGGHA
jgi:hypothetical protein